MPDKLQIPDVSAERMERLRAFLARDGLNVVGDAGTVRGDCIDVAFQYDRGAGVLEVAPARLPSHLEDEDGAEPFTALRGMLDVALGSSADLPSHCGVYTYALVNIDNQSGLLLTYGSSEIEHGTLGVNAQQIESGASTRAFSGESEKGSTVGVSGTVHYGLADGVTTLNISYSMVIAASAAYNAGLTGANAARYTITNKDTDGFTHGYTYMTPTTTIAKAS